MPYASIEDLPPSVANHLPTHAQEIDPIRPRQGLEFSGLIGNTGWLRVPIS